MSAPNILWVDDQAAGITRLIDVMQLFGHSVTVRTDASQALNELSLNHEKYCAIIIDVMLPSGDRKDLFPNGSTDDGLSTGALLIDYVINGNKSELMPLPRISKKIVILSGASVERIIAKIQIRSKLHSIPYRQKGIHNDPVEFANFIDEFCRTRNG